MKKTLNKGFTLIELLVVVAIIAILALVVLLAINPVEMARKSRDSRRLSDIGTIRKAIDLSLADKKTLTNTANFIELNTSTSVKDLDGKGLDVSKYLSVVAQDPIYDSAGGSVQFVQSDCKPGNTTKDKMVYEYMSKDGTYILRTRLESTDNCDAVNQDGNPDEYFETGTQPGLKY